MEWRPGNSGALGRHGVEHALPVADCCNNQYTTAGESSAFPSIISCLRPQQTHRPAPAALLLGGPACIRRRLRLVHAKTSKELKAAVVSSSVVGL